MSNWLPAPSLVCNLFVCVFVGCKKYYFSNKCLFMKVFAMEAVEQYARRFFGKLPGKIFAESVCSGSFPEKLSLTVSRGKFVWKINRCFSGCFPRSFFAESFLRKDKVFRELRGTKLDLSGESFSRKTFREASWKSFPGSFPEEYS